MGKGNWLTSKRMKKILGFLAFVLVLVWDMVKLIEVSVLGKRRGCLGPRSSKNRKAIAVKFSDIEYYLFIYTLVNKLNFVKILDSLFNQKIFSGFINSHYFDTSVFLEKKKLHQRILNT